MGPGDLKELLAPLARSAGRDERVLVGPEEADDAGVFRLDGRALIATVDFITPVCDEPYRFGRVAAANALSDVFAMGGQALLALNVCCFPATGVPDGVLGEILRGAAAAVAAAGAAVVGGHSVSDAELKFGLAVVGEGSPERLLTTAGARPGDRLLLTKPLGTGVLINAFKFDKLGSGGLEPALVEMERLNAEASRLALEHGARAATDVTGFGFAGHALGLARASSVGLRVVFDRLPVHEPFFELVRRGVSTACTEANELHLADNLRDLAGLDAVRRQLLFDPQTSGGLLLSVPPAGAAPLLAALLDSGHRAAEIGEVIAASPRLELV